MAGWTIAAYYAHDINRDGINPFKSFLYTSIAPKHLDTWDYSCTIYHPHGNITTKQQAWDTLSTKFHKESNRAINYTVGTRTE